MGFDDTVYVTYIAAPPDKVWQALTDAEFTKQYFFGRSIESDWQPGSTVNYWKPDGTLDVTGTILEIDPPKRLSFTWLVAWLEELRDLPPCTVTFQIDDLGGVVRLTMTEEHPEPLKPEYLEGGRKGWPAILSGLKSLLETGKALPEFNPMG